MDEYIVGIDISSSKVCGVVGSLDKYNEVQITGITTSDYCGIKDDVTVDSGEMSYVIKGVLSRLEEIVGSPLKKVYVSIPISLCEVVKTKGVISFPQAKEIAKEDIENVCEVAKFSVGKDKELIQVDIEEYIVDDMHNISNPMGMKGKLLQSEGNAFILSNKYVNLYRDCLNKIGVEIEGWVVNSIGMSKDILTDDELENGVALIDVGSSSMEATVFNKRKFIDFLSVPLGGKNITKDISICLKLSLTDSERLKVKCNTLLKDKSTESHRIKINTENGQCIDVNHELLVDVIRERVKELLEIIDGQLQKEGMDKQIQSYVIVGGGIALFRDIIVVGNDIMGKPVRIGVPNYVGAANPVYATATGILNNVLKKKIVFNDENKQDEDLELVEEHSHKNDNKIMTMIKRVFKGFSNEEVIK